MSETQAPYITQALRDLDQQLTGNQSKILRTIQWLDLNSQPTTPDNVAKASNLARATVYRALHNMAAMDLLQIRAFLTDTGRKLVDYTLNSNGAALVHHQGKSNIIDIPTRSPECQPKFETPISNRDKLTANFETPVSISDSPRGDQPSVNKDSTKYKQVNPYRLNSHDQTRATELAESSSRQLGDTHSLGQHILVWMAALHTDRNNGNHDCESELTRLMFQLRARKQEQQRPQGAAWNNRTKGCFPRWGIADPMNRSAQTAPAGNPGYPTQPTPTGNSSESQP